jgi:NAD-dependent dihydropyrimidine dehydrogenase PreA subunit
VGAGGAASRRASRSQTIGAAGTAQHPMTYVIAEPCIGVKDRSCLDVCPVDCIYEGEDQLYIEPDECID